MAFVSARQTEGFLREVDTIGAMRRLNAHRVFSLIVGFCALIGWSGFAYSTGASANVQRELRAELAQLKAGQEQLLAERHQQQAALDDLTQVQSKLAAARAELAALSQRREQVNTQVVAVRQELTVFAKRLADRRSKASKAHGVRLAEQSSKTTRGQSELRPKT
jgi:uncharacterized protein (DUF3084 family)